MKSIRDIFDTHSAEYLVVGYLVCYYIYGLQRYPGEYYTRKYHPTKRHFQIDLNAIQNYTIDYISNIDWILYNEADENTCVLVRVNSSSNSLSNAISSCIG